MADAITYRDLFGFKVGNNQFVLRDNRMENIINIAEKADSKCGGIVYDGEGLYLQYGGYYDDGAAIVDTSGSTVTNSEPGVQAFSTIYAVQSNDGWLTDEGTTNVFMLYSWEDANGNTGEEELNITGTFIENSQNPGYYGFYEEGSQDYYQNDYIREIALTYDRSWEITIYFGKVLAEVQIDEIGVYTIGSEPMTWPIDLLPIDDIYDAIVSKLDADGYITAQQPSQLVFHKDFF